MLGALFDERGTATVEYITLLILLSLPIALALYALGPGILDVFEARVAWLALPIP